MSTLRTAPLLAALLALSWSSPSFAQPSPDSDIRPAKPAIEVVDAAPLWPWGLAGAAATAFAAGALWWRRRRPAPITPRQRLEQGLEDALSARDAGDQEAYADLATTALRDFVAEMFDVPTSLTTPELRSALAELMPEDVRDGLHGFLEAADAVRFAGATMDASHTDAPWLEGLLVASELDVPPDASDGAHPHPPLAAK